MTYWSLSREEQILSHMFRSREQTIGSIEILWALIPWDRPLIFKQEGDDTSLEKELKDERFENVLFHNPLDSL